MPCHRCGAENRDGARFCDACGEKLAPPRVDSAPPESSDRGEQRHVTVMFCDLVDSTAHSQRLELEAWRDLVREFQAICFREVSHAGGFVAQYLGDGVLTYFGYPVAREQDAQAAVRTALDIIRAFEQRPPSARPVPLSVRVGIDSGVVLASEMGFGANRQPLAIGQVPNVAARIQAQAHANTVVISEATHRLVRDFFVCRHLGIHHLRGVERPLQLYEVSRKRPGDRHTSARAGAAPLVGRTGALKALYTQWTAARESRGQIVLVTGEAGVGKSRLARELKAKIAHEPHLKVELHGAPHNESSALFPVLELLRRSWHLERSKSVGELQAKLERGLGPWAERPDSMALMTSLFEVVPSDGSGSSENTPRRRKELTLELLADLLFNSATHRPTLLVIEDLHWIDPSTQDLLQLIAGRIRTAPLLMVLLSRAPETPAWLAASDVTRVELSRLDRDETEAMIRSLSGAKPLPLELVDDLVAKSDGVPLYIEEVTRMVLDAGLGATDERGPGQARSLVDLGIPVTLQESLIARLDRLGPARDLAQLGAAIGRSFDLELLRAVATMDEGTLRARLARLEELDILRPSGTPAAEAYSFKHALIQDAAYASLVRSRRRDHHRRIAEVLEKRGGDGLGARPEILAHHWIGAERPELAIPLLLTAGKRAFERSAYVEAGRHLQQGLGLLPALPDGDAHRALELELSLALGPVLVSTRGYSNPEVEQLYARARALCPQAGNDRLLYAVLSGLHLFHQSRAELTICLELTERRLCLARLLDDPALEMHVLETAGTIAFWRGEHAAALTALGDALGRYEPERGRAIRLMYGTDSRVVSEAYQGLALWYSGLPDSAIARSLTAVAHARELDDIHSLSLALVFAAIVHLNRGELDEARALAEEAITRCTEQRLEQWLGAALFLKGLIMVRLGRAPEGFMAMSEGGAVYRAVGAKVGAKFFASSMGEAFLTIGQAEQGLGALVAFSEGLGAGEDICHDADLARVEGQLLLAAATGPAAVAIESLERGLTLARAQGARSLELRCSTVLAGLRRDDGRPAEARALLAPLLASFTEGEGTSDARAARALLASLPSDA
ncbi:MAG TPA: AAA family ATPase [Polyangia bacterium]|jgi:class 3 adenylate cyclase/tetratricopeptide (TPR) repeat protein